MFLTEFTSPNNVSLVLSSWVMAPPSFPWSSYISTGNNLGISAPAQLNLSSKPEVFMATTRPVLTSNTIVISTSADLVQ